MLLLHSEGLMQALPAAYSAFNRMLTEREAQLGLEETAVGAPAADRKRYIEFGPKNDLSMPPALMSLRQHLTSVVMSQVEHIQSSLFPKIPGDIINISDWIDSPVLRLSSYPAGFNGTVNHPHTDIDLFTVLPAATAAGLEIMKGCIWENVTLHTSEILVLPGEMLQHFGGMGPVMHRVVSDGTERISASLFVNAQHDLTTLSGKSIAEIFAARLAKVRGVPTACGSLH